MQPPKRNRHWDESTANGSGGAPVSEWDDWDDWDM